MIDADKTDLNAGLNAGLSWLRLHHPTGAVRWVNRLTFEIILFTLAITNDRCI